MNYKIISSCSTGNAVILKDIILIDCGVTFKKLADERPTLRFACGEWLLKDLLECGVNKKNIDVLEIGTKYDYKAFKVVPVKLYHDVSQCRISSVI